MFKPLTGKAIRSLVQAIGAALVTAGASGCGDHADPSAANEAANSDALIMLALDCYNPRYKIDENGRVNNVRLGGGHVSADVLAQVAKLSELRSLTLGWSTVTNKDLAQLKDLRKLTHIGLVGTRITDEGLTHLEALPNLLWVWLPKQGVSAQAVEKLKAARPELHIYRQ